MLCLLPCSSKGSKIFWAGPIFFVPDLKLIHIIMHGVSPKLFCARPKDDFHAVNSFSVPAQYL